jgi:uncharacterized Zn-binding protein involved in type VI secretion
MEITVRVNGNTLVHKGTIGTATNTLPDVCKTPSPGGPVPIPYPKILSFSKDLANGTTTVKVDGGNMAATKGSEFSRCVGDEAGTAGGIKSSTNMKEAKWLLYSFDVKMDGENVCRKTDKMTMNHGNTFCLSGEDDFEIQGVKDFLCAYFCEKLASEEGWTRSYDFEQEMKGQCPDGYELKFPPETSTTVDWAGDPIPRTIPDCTLCQDGRVVQCFDFKGRTENWEDDWFEDQYWRQEQIAGRPPIKISAEDCGCDE